MAASLRDPGELVIEQSQEQILGNDQDAGKYLELHANKVFHIFFAHDTADEDFVVKIVHTLEKKHNMKCCFSRRDFQPGEPIYSQIYENMKRSVKVLLLLSPDFVRSSWCEYETRLAFQMSLEEEMTSLIPVMYRECEVPYCLRSLNYIDCCKGEDLEMRILKSFEPKDQDLDQGRSGEKGLRYDINGARIIFEASTTSSSRIERKWQFGAPTGKHFRSMESGGIKLDLEDFMQFWDEVNNTFMLKYFGLLACSTRSAKCFFLLTQVFNLTVVGIIFSCLELSPSVNRSDVSIFNMIVFMVLVVGVGSVAQSILMYCFQYKFWWRLQRKVLAYNMRRYSSAKCLLFFDCSQKPMICMIRYDTHPCKVFLMGILKKQYEKNNALTDEEQQIKADVRSDILLVQCFINFYDELFKWTSLPDAEERRHETLNEKKCLCQLVEDTKLKMKTNEENIV